MCKWCSNRVDTAVCIASDQNCTRSFTLVIEDTEKCVPFEQPPPAAQADGLSLWIWIGVGGGALLLSLVGGIVFALSRRRSSEASKNDIVLSDDIYSSAALGSTGYEGGAAGAPAPRVGHYGAAPRTPTPREAESSYGELTLSTPTEEFGVYVGVQGVPTEAEEALYHRPG